ncbi:response regulator [Dehalococcoidia bacterium]|nr:response regulator [Dehalococcoidia bacterium]MCL0098359.1 response regulator [Dehalococcoidia bacterium]
MAKVLVVDDAQFMRMRATKLLTQNGYEVIEAANGVEAVQKYKEKQLRKIDPGARIAMVTAMGQQSIVLEAIKAGARDFVVKPFDPNRVLAAVQKMIG